MCSTYFSRCKIHKLWNQCSSRSSLSRKLKEKVLKDLEARGFDEITYSYNLISDVDESKEYQLKLRADGYGSFNLDIDNLKYYRGCLI